MEEKLSKQYCIRLLQAKAADTHILPKKSDFTEQEVAQIKSYLGPWPRALETAGIKESRNDKQK